jgi:uncharacterized protein
MQIGNSRMKRSKAILEIAAGVYEDRMLQLGVDVSVGIRSSKEEDNIYPPLTFGVGGELMGGMKAPIEVGHRRVDVSYVNPSVIVTMAYRGKGFYKEALPLRALACFPSWDRIAFVVSKDLEVRSLWDIKKKRVPLVVSTRASGIHNSTHYAISTILSLYGLSFKKITHWGGKVDECAHPSSPKRIESIRKQQVNAIFDEGLPTQWLEPALENGYEVLHIEEDIIRRMEAIGFKRALIPKKKYPRLKEDVRTLDFSGWPVITHKWLSNEMAYSICDAIFRRRRDIPVDAPRLDVKSLCRDTDAGPLGIPLHPGARKFYKEKGLL